MTISKKNFSNWDVTTIPVDTEYVRCNFSQSVPDTSGADPVGIRLFPGDDTPRTFTDCNMVNCEPPPGSTLTGCNTSVCEYEQPDVEETITIDSVVVYTRQFTKQIIYGRWNPDTEVYDYHPSPIEVPE